MLREIKIDKGIPIPTNKRFNRPNCTTELLFRLKVGDSFITTLKKYGNIYSVGYHYGINLKYKTIQKPFIRVWRAK